MVGDLDVIIGGETRRVFTLLQDARAVLLNLGVSGAFDVASWAARARLIDARYTGAWALPVLGEVAAPPAVLIRPDGHVARVGEGNDVGLRDALARWFGSPTAARRHRRVLKRLELRTVGGRASRGGCWEPSS